MPLLEIGDPAPWFSIASTNNPLFHFSMAGGRRVVLFFFGSAAFEQIQAILKSFQELSEEFQSLQVPLFGVSVDAADKEKQHSSPAASHRKMK